MTTSAARSFADGLVPTPDFRNNARNSAFFSQLPGEIRNTIYAMVFTQTGFDKNAGRGKNLSGVALRTCRQFYVEAATYLYSENRHKIKIDPDMAIFNAGPRILSPFVSTRNIGMIRHLELALKLPEEGEAGIPMEKIQSEEEHLRAICLCLTASGAVLESLSLTVEVANGNMLDPKGGFHLLDTLKELRVHGEHGEVSFLGIKGGLGGEVQEVNELVQDLKNEMVAPDTVDDDGRSQLQIRCMCQDLWDYFNVCIEHVEDLAPGSVSDGERAAAIDELRMAFDVGQGLRGEMHFPVGRKPIEVIGDALWSVEVTYTKIDEKRFPEYFKAANQARDRLYFRKAFREMVPHEVPDYNAFD